ncbi:MAG: hypothetical protein OXE57_07510, partial [Alphaproteobacteria bacterium]|nr:hypothetical protein [Alphaproteobacteria bacterium]
ALPQDILDLVEEHGREMRARDAVDGWSRTMRKLAHGRDELVGQAADGKLAIAELPDWPKWREDARAAVAAGRSLLADADCAPGFDRNAGLRAAIGIGVRRLAAGLEREASCARLIREWTSHVRRARAARIRPSTLGGHGELAARMAGMAGRTDLDKPSTARLAELLRENERRERAQIGEDIASQRERLLEWAGGDAELLPYQFDYDPFREAVTEARGLFDPDSEFGERLGRFDKQMDGAEKRMHDAEALRERAVSLAGKALELDRRAADDPGAPMHEQRGFRVWRRDADRFLDDRRTALRDRLMAPHLDRSSIRSMLETSASILEQERFRAPKQETRQEAARRQRTQTLDRSEGGGMKL